MTGPWGILWKNIEELLYIVMAGKGVLVEWAVQLEKVLYFGALNVDMKFQVVKICVN